MGGSKEGGAIQFSLILTAVVLCLAAYVSTQTSPEYGLNYITLNYKPNKILSPICCFFLGYFIDRIDTKLEWNLNFSDSSTPKLTQG